MPLLESLLKASQAATRSQLLIESARDRIRLELHQTDSEEFPLYTSQGTDIYTLCSYMLEQYYNYWYRQYRCTACDSIQKAAPSSNQVYNDIFIICSKYQWQKQGIMQGSAYQKTASEWIYANTRQMTSIKCTDCSSHLILEAIFLNRPIFLKFRVDDVVVKWTPVLQIDDCQYRLCELIYYGSNHFTARIVTENQEIWFNDDKWKSIQFRRRSCRYDTSSASYCTKHL